MIGKGQVGSECRGTHRYFVADVAIVPREGKVSVIVICTACGDSLVREHVVALPNTDFETQLTKEKLQ